MIRLLAMIFGSLLSTMAMAIHLDVAVSVEGGQLKTDFCLEGGPACDTLPVLSLLGVPEGTLPIDTATGHQIFVTDFDDFEGGPNAVDDPGFISGSGQLPPSLRLSYKAVGSLSYWGSEATGWTNDIPGTTRIELFGGLQEVFINDPSACGGFLICPVGSFEQTSTLFTESGISGNPSLIVAETDASGALHTHLDWFLEDGNDNPGGPDGAYMIDMQLTAPGLLDSETFSILFGKGLTLEEFGQALGTRIGATAVPISIPTFYMLLMAIMTSMITVRRSSCTSVTALNRT